MYKIDNAILGYKDVNSTIHVLDIELPYSKIYTLKLVDAFSKKLIE